jgi:UDP:flavonoid glycosyltransferase YjiC (YdhE family)
MRFLFVVFSRGGHLNPMIAVAQHLEHHGHDAVLFSLGDDIGPVAARAGLRARTARFAAAASSAPVEAQRSRKLGERANQPAWARRFHQVTLLDPVAAQVAQLAALAAEVAPDAIAVDPLAYAGAIVAARAGLPWACLVTGLQSLTIDGRRALDAGAFDQLALRRDQLVASLGAPLTFRACDVVSPWANLLFVYDGLFPHGPPAGLTCVGPALPRAGRGDEPAFDASALPADRPIVYVSFGSQLSHGPEIYEAVWGALSADEAVFVTTLTDLIEEPFVRARPAHVIAVAYAPQLALLERASVMVTHGGANSVMEALSRGCPMLVIPIAYDQPLLGHLVQAGGAGTLLEARGEITPARCRECLLPLLPWNNPVRARARALAGRHEDGGERAARLLVELAARRVAVR